MAVSMRTTRGMALSLAFCVLLLHGGIHCQEPTAVDTVEELTTPAVTDDIILANTTATSTSATDNGVGFTDPPDSIQGFSTIVRTSAAVDDTTMATATATADVTAEATSSKSGNDVAFTPLINIDIFRNVGVFGGTTGPKAGSHATDPPTNILPEGGAPVKNENPAEPETKAPVALGKPTVECVDEDALKNKAVVHVKLMAASSCSDTKKSLEEAVWCPGDCKLQVFQDKESNKLVLARVDGPVKDVMESLNNGNTKKQLGIVKATHSAEKSSIVLIFMLVTFLLLAAALIGGYCVKTNRGHTAKGMRLAEEAYPVDEENQGNTLVSVAPLNPPETVEKTVNGEPQEAAKTQPPPTNGHSTTKTADTEL